MATRTQASSAPTLDFAVIGAAKAGTTALYSLLRTHPELHLPTGKEFPYFGLPKSDYYDSPAEFFAEVFQHRGCGQRCGTVTPQYLYGALLGRGGRREEPAGGPPETAIPALIRGAYPGARLIAILRDPVARARSHHRMTTVSGLERRSLDLAIDDLLDPNALSEARARPSETNGYVVFGEYGRLLRGYFDVFPREQLLVLFQDELKHEPEAVCATVFAFLGVDPGFRPEALGRRYNVGGSPRRFDWLDPARWQRAAARSAPLRRLWRLAPPSSRRRALRRFDLASRQLFRWNRVPPEAQAAPDLPSAETLARLRDHYLQDEGLLGKLLDGPPPWARAGPGE